MPDESCTGLRGLRLVRIIALKLKKNEITAEQVAAYGLPYVGDRLAPTICDGAKMETRRVSGFSRLAATLLCCAAPVAAASATDRIALTFDVLGPLGMRVLEMHSLLEENPGRYAVSVNYATTGLAGLFIDQRTYAVAHGQLIPGSALPFSFRNQTRRNGVERNSQVSYSADGTVRGSSNPPPRNIVAPEAARGTVDNLSAYLRLERQVATRGTCAMTVPVFDGRHRYDLVFTDGGRQELSPQSGQNFEGVAIACNMTRYNRSVDEAEKDEGAQSGTIWYARLISGSNMMFPVRMKLSTSIGDVDAYLAELQSNKGNLKLRN
jgi:Protein of unknown function (DUF3108)